MPQWLLSFFEMHHIFFRTLFRKKISENITLKHVIAQTIHRITRIIMQTNDAGKKMFSDKREWVRKHGTSHWAIKEILFRNDHHVILSSLDNLLQKEVFRWIFIYSSASVLLFQDERFLGDSANSCFQNVHVQKVHFNNNVYSLEKSLSQYIIYNILLMCESSR